MGTLAAIEMSIIAAVKADLGSRVRTVDSAPGEWDDDLLKRMLVLAPFVLVAFAGGRPPEAGGQQPAVLGQWEVYVGTAHASGQAARRLGDAQQIGAYELLERVVTRLHNYTVPNVGTLTLQSVENLFSGNVERQGLTVYGAVYQVPMEFDAQAVSLDDFATLNVQYDIPAHVGAGQHAAWLAGNYTSSRPDATDTVTLPTD